MNSYSLEVVEQVDLELVEHWAFLESRLPGLGDRLLEEVEMVFDLLKQDPYLFQKRHSEFRMATTRRLRYKIIYLMKHESVVRVVAIRHPKQHPTSWMKRL